MEENHNKLQKQAQEMHRKFLELSIKQNKISYPTATTTSVSQVIQTLDIICLSHID